MNIWWCWRCGSTTRNSEISTYCMRCATGERCIIVWMVYKGYTVDCGGYTLTLTLRLTL